MFLQVEMHKVKSDNVFGGVEVRRNVWFTFFGSKREAKRYD